MKFCKDCIFSQPHPVQLGLITCGSPNAEDWKDPVQGYSPPCDRMRLTPKACSIEALWFRESTEVGGV